MIQLEEDSVFEKLTLEKIQEESDQKIIHVLT